MFHVKHVNKKIKPSELNEPDGLWKFSKRRAGD